MRAALIALSFAATAVPVYAASYECVPDTTLTWSTETALTPIPAEKRDTTFVTTVDTVTGVYTERAYILSVAFDGTYTIVSEGDLSGPIDFVGIDPKSGEQIRIAIWHDPVTFLRISGNSLVVIGTCAEVE